MQYHRDMDAMKDRSASVIQSVQRAPHDVNVHHDRISFVIRDASKHHEVCSFNTQYVQPLSVSIGERCIDGDICLGSSECVRGQCECPSGHIQRGAYCMTQRRGM
jgi:hypothetical protein